MKFGKLEHPMATIKEGIEAFFKQDEWTYGPGRLDNTLVTGFKGDAGRWSCLAYAAEQQQQLMFYSVAPFDAPPERVLAVSEFVHRANYGLHIGNFELDMGDGEVRFKTSIDTEGTDLSFELVRNVVYANVMQMDRYLPGLMAVLGGLATPAEAIDQVENPPET